MIRHKIFFLITFFVLSLSSCTKKQDGEEITGDLYYKVFGTYFAQSFYNLPDSTYAKYESLPDSITKKDTVMALLKDKNLIKSPYIFLKEDNKNEFTIIYMNQEQYSQFTKFKYQDLIDKKQKVRIKLYGEKIADRKYKCLSIASVDAVEGETFEKQLKFKMDEYE